MPRKIGRNSSGRRTISIARPRPKPAGISRPAPKPTRPTSFPRPSSSGGSKEPRAFGIPGVRPGQLPFGGPRVIPSPPKEEPQGTSVEDLVSQSIGEALKGANFLGGAPVDPLSTAAGKQATSNLQGAADKLFQNASLATGQMNESITRMLANRDKASSFADEAIDPRLSDNLKARLEERRLQSLEDIERLFAPGGAKMDAFQKQMADLRANQFADGMLNSKQAATGNAELQRDLFRDRAGQIQNANNLSFAQELDQLDNTRNANQTNASLFSNMSGQDLSAAQNFLSQANDASSSAGSLGAAQGNLAVGASNNDLGFRQLGANMLNNGINNQFNAIGLDAQLKQQQFEAQLRKQAEENFARQQILENVIGRRSRKEAKRQFDELIEASNSSGGGLLGGLLGGAGIGSKFGPKGAAVGGVLGGIGGLFS